MSDGAPELRDGPPELPEPRPHWLRALADHSGVRYLVVGGTAFLLDIGLLALFHEVLHLPLWISSGAAFILSFFYTYTVQRAFSFGGESPHGPALVKYTLLVAANTVATMGIVALVDATGAGWVIGKVLSTGITTVWNYFAYRYWVFRAPASTGGRD